MKILTALADIWLRLAKRKTGNLKGLPKPISDHLARDIGLTDADLARHRFVWPSESKDRPLL